MVVSNAEMYFQQDDDGNLLETEFGLSVYKDHQTFSIQVSLSRVIVVVTVQRCVVFTDIVSGGLGVQSSRVIFDRCL